MTLPGGFGVGGLPRPLAEAVGTMWISHRPTVAPPHRAFGLTLAPSIRFTADTPVSTSFVGFAGLSPSRFRADAGGRRDQ